MVRVQLLNIGCRQGCESIIDEMNANLRQIR
jgi:hypothetical protein